MNAQDLINKVTKEDKILKASVNANVNESRVNRFIRNNKSLSGIFVLILIMSVVFAVTTITDTNVNSPTGTYTNISADRINEVLYVQAGNASDIQATIDKCLSRGCHVIIPSGNYTLTGVIGAINVRNKNNIKITGNGENTKILLNTAGTDFGHVFRLDNSSNMEIGDLWFENIGSGDNDGAIRVDTTGSSNNLYFHDLTIKNFDKGGGAPTSAAGIKIGEQTNPKRAITNVVIERVISDNNYRGFYINVGSYGVTLRDTYSFNNRKAGIESDGSSSVDKPSESLQIYNCWSENDNQHGILLEGTREAIVQGCRIINSTEWGITIYGKYEPSIASNIRIVDNFLIDSGLAQIHIRTFPYNLSRIIISGNNIFRNKSTTSNSAQGILIRPEDSNSAIPEKIIITGNIIDIAKGTTHNSAALSIQIQGSIFPNDIIIADNYFYPSPASSVSASATNVTILNNRNLPNNLLGNLNILGNFTLRQKITFALGEIIDNIIDGWIQITGSLKVTGDLNVTGDITFGTSAIPANSTMYSPDGTEFTCGVNNSGSFLCS